MKVLKYILVFLFTLLIHTALLAQAPVESQPPADFMVSNGKIFVVVAVVFTIVLGLFIYLFCLDKKLTQLENKEK